MSKSELKRTATMNPIAMAERVAKLEQQLIERDRRIDALALIRCKLEQQVLERDALIEIKTNALKSVVAQVQLEKYFGSSAINGIVKASKLNQSEALAAHDKKLLDEAFGEPVNSMHHIHVWQPDDNKGEWCPSCGVHRGKVELVKYHYIAERN